MPRLRTPRRFQNGKHMSRVKNDNLMKMYSSKERRGFWAALGRLWAGFVGSLAVMCLLGLQRHDHQDTQSRTEARGNDFLLEQEAHDHQDARSRGVLQHFCIRAFQPWLKFKVLIRIIMNLHNSLSHMKM